MRLLIINHTQIKSTILWLDFLVLPVLQDSVGLCEKIDQIDSHEGEAEHGDAHGGVGQRDLHRRCVKLPDHHTNWLRFSTRISGAHVGHVADRHELTGGYQVEAVHLVLHAASDLAVATAEVRHHERGRSGRHDRLVWQWSAAEILVVPIMSYFCWM